MRAHVAIFALVLLPVSGALVADEPDAIPVRNWSVSFDDVVARRKPGAQRYVAATDDAPAIPSTFVTVVPCRLVDTRLAAGPYGGPSFAAGSTRAFDIPANPCNVPLAAAYSLNVTAARYQARGFITAFPTGASVPITSTLNFGDPPPPPEVPASVANAAIVPADANGSISIFAFAATDVVIDINGYFVNGVVTSINAAAPISGGGAGSNVTLGITPGGISSNEMGPESVTNAAIPASTITAAKIDSGEVVKTVNTLTDVVSVEASSNTTVSVAGNAITIGTALPLPLNAVVLGLPGDTTLINAGYGEVGPSSIDAWRKTSLVSAPQPAGYHTTVWTGTRMIVWGGFPLPTNAGGLYDPATDTWQPTSIVNAPSARFGHTAIWTGSRMVIWGGNSFSPRVDLASGGQYDPVANTWTPTNTTGALARAAHTAVWTGTYMVVYGGQNGDTVLGDCGRYRPQSDDWLPTNAAIGPGPRTFHTAVWNTLTNRMIIWGGQSATTIVNTGGLYDPELDTWTATSTTNAPTPRTYQTAVWTGSRLIVWGGFSQITPPLGDVSTGAIYNPATDTWTAMSLAGAPARREGAESVWTGDRLIVWGGYDLANAKYLNSGGAFDPATNTWGPPLTTSGAPAGRNVHSQVWTGSRLVIWGGFGREIGAPTDNYLNSGGQWLYLSVYQKN